MTREEILEKTIDFDDAINRIVRLEKENKELKSIAQFQQSRNMDARLQLKRSNERLTKAKEIITKLVEGIRIISEPKVCMADVDAFVSEAEQFLWVQRHGQQ